METFDYGLFGGLAYDADAQRWASRRSLRTLAPLTPVDAPETYILGCRPPPAGASNEQDPAQNLSTKSVRELVNARPEFQSGIDVIYDLHLQSRPYRTRIHKVSGDLLVLGRVRQTDCSQAESTKARPQARSVVCVPSGFEGDRLCILEVEQSNEGWDDRQDTWLECVDLQNAKQVFWDGDCSCIRQLCFATASDDDDAHAILAVRTTMSIHLLRLHYSSGGVAVKYVEALQMPSQIDADCVDMAFNHWNQKQLATVTSGGTFTIWDIEQGDDSCRATMQYSNQKLQDEPQKPAKDSNLFDDGWRRVLWIDDSQSIVVCSRSHLECFNLAGQLLGRSSSFKEPHDKSFFAIHDVRTSPSRDDDLFLVTATKWIWLRMTIQDGEVSFDAIVSWRHHRDVNDLSLRLTVLESSDEFRVMLYSQCDNLISEFRVAEPEDSFSAISQGTPTRCDWHGSTGPLDIRFVKLGLRRQNNRSSPHWSRNVTFWQALILGSDLSLQGWRFHDQPDIMETIKWPNWKSIIGGKPDLPQNDAISREEVFVVEDQDSGVDDPDFVEQSEMRVIVPSGDLLQTEYTLPSEAVMVEIQETVQNDTSDLMDILENFTGLAVQADRRLQTLCSSISKPLKVDDVDRAFAFASRLVDRVRNSKLSENSLNDITPLATPTALGLIEFHGSGEFLSMPLLYRRLLSIYNSHLGPDVRGQTRLSKEKVVRSAAATIFLASIGHCNLSQSGNATQSLQRTETDRDSQNSLLEVSSIASSSSDDRLDVAAAHTLSESYERLHKYARMPLQQAHASSSLASKEISQILGHWTLHADPSEYSYLDVSAEAAGEMRIEGSQLSVEAREEIGAKRRRIQEREEAQMSMAKDVGDFKRRKLDRIVEDDQQEPFSQATDLEWASPVSHPQRGSQLLQPQRGSPLSQPQQGSRASLSQSQSRSLFRSSMQSVEGTRLFQTQSSQIEGDGHHKNQPPPDSQASISSGSRFGSQVPVRDKVSRLPLTGTGSQKKSRSGFK